MGKTQKILWVAVGVIVVLLLAVYITIFYKRKLKVSPSTPAVNVGVTVPPTQNLTPLKGVLPPNFPTAILVGSSPAIVASGYSYDEKTNTDSWVVTATSAKSLASFAQAYDSYFKANSWTVATKTLSASQLYYFAYSKKNGASVNITINTLPTSGNYIDINLKQPHAK